MLFQDYSKHFLPSFLKQYILFSLETYRSHVSFAATMLTVTVIDFRLLQIEGLPINTLLQ